MLQDGKTAVAQTPGGGDRRARGSRRRGWLAPVLLSALVFAAVLSAAGSASGVVRGESAARLADRHVTDRDARVPTYRRMGLQPAATTDDADPTDPDAGSTAGPAKPTAPGASAGSGSQPAGPSAGAATANSFNIGDVFVGGLSSGSINRYSAVGTSSGSLATGGTSLVTGMCFDLYGNLYATNFNDQTVTKFDDTGARVAAVWHAYNGVRPESCTSDGLGNVYVSEVDAATGFTDQVVKYDANGHQVATYKPAIENRGIDWIDLSGDGCTLFYTSEGPSVKRFDLCTNTQLTDFAAPVSVTDPCFALKIRSDGGLMVACHAEVNWLSSTGSLIRSYSASAYKVGTTQEGYWFAFAVDQSGSNFWVADYNTHDVLNINADTGAQIAAFNNSAGTSGLAVYGAPRSGIPTGPPPPGVPPASSTYGVCDPRNYHSRIPRVRAACRAEAADPVSLATGAVTSTATDASMPSIGENFAFIRSYTSLDTATSELGVGWTDSYSDALTFGQGQITWRAGSGAQTTFTQQPDGSYAAPAWSTATLTAAGGGYTVVTGDQVHYLFDSQGRLTGVRDRNNEGVTIAYGSDGLRSTLTDSAGRVVTFQHNAQGLLSEILLPDGRNVQYFYTSGYLTSVTDLRGNTYGYGYDSQNRLQSETDQNNHQVVFNTYGPDGRISQQQDANGKITQFSWDAPTQTATVTDARNHVWTWRFDGTLLTEQDDPYGDATHYTYDLNTGDLIGFQDALGNLEEMTYDSRHNMLSRTSPSSLGYEEDWTYNSFNDPLTYNDGRRNETDYQYDSAGNLTQVTGPDPDGSGPLGRPVTVYTRDPGGTGLVTAVSDPRQKVTSYGYDPTTHQLTSIRTPLGETTTFTYDPTGRLATSVEPRGNATGGIPSDYTTTYSYDKADHLTKVTSPDPDGAGPQQPLVTQWLYDPAGNLQTYTDANSQPTDYGYDNADRITSVTAPDPDGAGPLTRPVTQYTYDEVGNLQTRTVAGTHTTSYGYDDANRLTSVTSPTGQLWTYTYDANGDRVTQTDPNGNATPTSGDGTTTYGYDALGRLSSIGYSDGTPAVSFSYDANDNRIGMTYGPTNVSYSYDALNRLASVVSGPNTFSYTYDIAGNLAQTTYPDTTTVSRTYDDDERLAAVVSGGQTTSYGYDPASNLTTTTLPSGNGYVETRTYDRAGRLYGVSNKKGTATLSSFNETLDPVGNPTTIAITRGTTNETDTYTYDNLGRIAGVCYQASCTHNTDPFIRWTYDDVGNRLTEARSSGTTSYTYNSADQLTQAGSTAYTYDQDGNLKTAGATSYSYDLANRLISTTSGTTTTTYTYNGLGQRLQASTGTQAAKTTNYLWDINDPSGLPQIALEQDGSGHLLRRYVYGPERISMNTGSAAYYYHYDPIGSAVNLSSSTGATEWTDSYEPYGAVHSETKNDTKAPANVMKFDGQYLDATGLYHLRARQYDTATGRFSTIDPLRPGPGSLYWSTYTYADDQPTTLVDPSGMGAVGSSCNPSLRCWGHEEVMPYVNACLEGGAQGAAVTVATGGAGAAEAIYGCAEGVVAKDVERHVNDQLGKTMDAVGSIKHVHDIATKAPGSPFAEVPVVEP